MEEKMRIVPFLLLPVLAFSRPDTLVSQMAEKVARLFNSEAREAGPRLEYLAAELDKLPALAKGSLGSRYGFHSGPISSQEEAHWVQFDLGKEYPIDTIVAVPVHAEAVVAGYGFPLRFTIGVSTEAEMQHPILLVDQTKEDVPNPGKYPMIFHPTKTTARYVRFTATRSPRSRDEFFWALEELMVLAGNRNVAAGCEVTFSKQLELFPNWAVDWINDGQSVLGVPVTTERSPTKGYLSAPANQPISEKWILVDLGKSYPIDELRLLPAGSTESETLTRQGYPRVGGRAFPPDLVVEISGEPTFTEPAWHKELETESLGYPWGNSVVLQTHGTTGRYIRVLARKLWARGKTAHNFALAELQAYVGDDNVALGKTVQARDAADGPGSARWHPDFLVDGFTGRLRLIELPAYLELIAQRGKLEREQATLQARRDQLVRQTRNLLTGSAVTLGSVALLGWAWMLFSQKAVRRRDVIRLREQIARDLHDDIGSNLGGIVLLSEMGRRHNAISPEAINDFAAIQEAAEATAESMQDIVWLIQTDRMGLREMIVKLRNSAAMIVGNLVLSIEVNPPQFTNRNLSLLFRRHFFFAFKETLNNIRKHACATRIAIAIDISSTSLKFTVNDNGKGFDPIAPANSGHGLANLQQRAALLKGTCVVDSKPGQGTTVLWEADSRV
jgi:signal transduction histidine kinase